MANLSCPRLPFAALWGDLVFCPGSYVLHLWLSSRAAAGVMAFLSYVPKISMFSFFMKLTISVSLSPSPLIFKVATLVLIGGLTVGVSDLVSLYGVKTVGLVFMPSELLLNRLRSLMEFRILLSSNGISRAILGVQSNPPPVC
jgi:hypothetical protein